MTTSNFNTHYFRLSRLYVGRGPGLPRIDESGIKALVKLREAYGNRPLPGLLETLAFCGYKWRSGWSTFEDRVVAITATYTEGALLRAQAA